MGRVQQPQAVSCEAGVTYSTAAAQGNGLFFWSLISSFCSDEQIFYLHGDSLM